MCFPLGLKLRWLDNTYQLEVHYFPIDLNLCLRWTATVKWQFIYFPLGFVLADRHLSTGSTGDFVLLLSPPPPPFGLKLCYS